MPARNTPERTTSNKKAGRPPLYKDRVRVTFDCESEVGDWLSGEAAYHGLSRSQLVARVIMEFRKRVEAEDRTDAEAVSNTSRPGPPFQAPQRPATPEDGTGRADRDERQASGGSSMRITGEELTWLTSICEALKYTLLEVTRVSDRPFDLHFEAERKDDWKASAWLPLSLLSCVDWTKLGDMSSYPQLTRDGDWSGIRDSTKEEIWAMFDHVKAQIENFEIPWANEASAILEASALRRGEEERNWLDAHGEL